MEMNSAGTSEDREDTDEGTVVPDENKKDMAKLHRKRKRRKGNRKIRTPKSYSDVESEADSSKELSKYHSLPNKRKNRRQGTLSIFFKKWEEKRRSGSSNAGKTSEIDSDWDDRNGSEHMSDGKRYTSIDPTLHPRDRLRRMTVKDALMEKRMKRRYVEHGSSNLEKTILDNVNSHSLTGSMPDLCYRDMSRTSTSHSPSSTLVPEYKQRSRSTESKLKKGRRVTQRTNTRIHKNVPANKKISDTGNQTTEPGNRKRHSISPHAIIYNTQPQLLSAEIPSRSQMPTDDYIKKSSAITTDDGSNKNQQDAVTTLLDAPADLESLSSSHRSLLRMSQISNESRQSFEDSERERRESFGKFMDLRRKLPTFSQSSLARVRNEELGEYSGLSSTDDDVWDTNKTISDSDLADNDILEKIKNLSSSSFHNSPEKSCNVKNLIGQNESQVLCCNETLARCVDTSANKRTNVVQCVDPSQHAGNENVVPSDLQKCAGKRKGSIRLDTSKAFEGQYISPTENIPGEVISPLKEQKIDKDKKFNRGNKFETKESTGDFLNQHLGGFAYEINETKYNQMEHATVNENKDISTKHGNGEKYSDLSARKSLSSEKDINYIRSVSDTGEGREPYKSPRRFVRNRSASNVPLEGYSCRLIPEKKYRSLSPLSPDQNMQTTNASNSNKDARRSNGRNENKKSPLKYRRSFSPKQRKNRNKSLGTAVILPEMTTCHTDVQATKISVAVQTSLDNVFDVYPSEDKGDKGNADMDCKKADICKKQFRDSFKKKLKPKENRKKKERKRRSKSKSLESLSRKSGAKLCRSRESFNDDKPKQSSFWDKIQSKQDTLSPTIKQKRKHTSPRDLISCKSSSALDVSTPTLLPEIQIEGVHSRSGRLSLDVTNLLKKSRSAAELQTPSTIDDILSCRPFGQLSVSSESIKISESQPSTADENDRKASTSSQQEPKKVEKRVDGAMKDTADNEATTKPQGKISILAIVALKRKLARRRKIKAETKDLDNKQKEETKDHEQETETDKYHTFVSIENETNLNLSELAFLKETAILGDDYYDGNDFHHPSKKKISFDPIVSDEPLEDEHIFGRHGTRFRERRDSTIREKQKKVLNCCKKFLAFLFSHIGLCTLVVAYSIMGGVIFKELEEPFEKKIKINVSEERKAICRDIGRLAVSVTLNKRGRDDFVTEVDRVLSKFQGTVWNAIEENGWNGKDYTTDEDQQWSYASSLLFAITIMTTIGYGHVAPKTPYGRIATIAYAILGIPLTLLCLTNIGDLMATGFRFLYGRVCCGWCCILLRRKRRLPDPERGLEHKGEVVIHQNDKNAEVIHVPTSICILLMTSYIFLGTLLFSIWEKWDMLKGTYFSFITLSTIGLGDVVPGTTMWESEMKLVLCALYLVFGLSLIAMCFNLVQEDVKAKCRWLGTKLGIIDSATSDV